MSKPPLQFPAPPVGVNVGRGRKGAVTVTVVIFSVKLGLFMPCCGSGSMVLGLKVTALLLL